MKICAGLLLGLVSISLFAQTPANRPDLSTLSQSGAVMGPGDASSPVSKSWQTLTTVMKRVNSFDAIVEKIQAVVCGTDLNKSVLIVGEPSLAYQYIFARMASNPSNICSKDMWHVNVNISKIEAGHRYVGDVDAYWQASILTPASGKDVVLYLDSISSLIGIGSHSNDDTGIEREYVANITSGLLRSVAFIDKYQYNDIIRSKDSYVLEAFADKIIIPSVDEIQTFNLADTYMKTLYPNLVLKEKELKYIIRTIEFYSPNRQEPDRTLSVINNLVRSFPGDGFGAPSTFLANIETKHPYDANSKVEFLIDQPSVQALQLVFDLFDLENKFDFLEVRDGYDGTLLDTIDGSLPAKSKSRTYATNKLSLIFISDGTNQKNGFKISQINGFKFNLKTITLEEARRSTMAVAQVPEWLVNRDYSVIKGLEGKLNGDVVGVTEGKKDMVRLAKNGYVAGRTDNKPIATTLLAGPTGTGKSYIAQKMAEFMGMKLITIDMTAYKEPSSFKTFVEVISRNLTNSPYAMYLFEEIDKAAVEVLDQLYFMMDEGVFYDSYQRPLFARGAFIMMTTNAGADVILQNPNDPDLRNKVLKNLRTHFRDSFLNRFDAVSIFKPFTDAEFLQLSHTLIDKKLKKIKNFYGWTMSVDEGTYNYISVKGRSAEYGARPMERLVEGTLGIGIAEFQLQISVIPEGAIVTVQKLAETHKFMITVNSVSLEYVVDSMSLNSFFQNLNNRKLILNFKAD